MLPLGGIHLAGTVRVFNCSRRGSSQVLLHLCDLFCFKSNRGAEDHFPPIIFLILLMLLIHLLLLILLLSCLIVFTVLLLFFFLIFGVAGLLSVVKLKFLLLQF